MVVDTVEEFNKLIQEGSLTNYHKKFEELSSHMLKVNPTLDKAYFISSFMSSRLNEEIRTTIKLFKPPNHCKPKQLPLKHPKKRKWRPKWLERRCE